MKNNKIISIIKNDVEKSIKNKWFVILNVLLLLVTVGGLNINNIKTLLKDNNVNVDKQISVYIEDNNDIAYDALSENLEKYENITVEKKESVSEYENENIDPNTVLVKVYPDDKNYLKAVILSKEGITGEYIDVITSTITSIKDTMFAKNKNLTEEEIEQIKSDVSYERVMLGKNVEDNENHSFLTMISTYFIFFILLLCLSKIANTISQEKMSKSIEYVLTSISTKEYLISKVVGMCLIVVIQFIFTLAYLLIGVMISSLLSFNAAVPETSQTVNVATIVSGKTIVYFIITLVFMVLTTFLQGIIQSVMSAKTTNIQEAGNATIFLVTINLVIYMIALFMISPLKSSTVFMYILSVIPIISMYFIPSMYIIGQANLIQVIISFILLVLSVTISVILSQKPFKNAILDFTPKKDKKIEGIEKITRTTEYQERMIERKNSSKKGLVIGFSVILLVLLQTIGGLLETIILPTLAEKIRFISYDSLYLLLFCIVFIVSVYIPYLFLKLYLPKEEKKKEDLNDEEILERKEDKKRSLIQCLKYIVISIPIISIIQCICSFAIEKIGVGSDVVDSLGLFNHSGKLSTVLMFILIALLPAIFEELFIRKGVMGILKSKGAIFSTIVSALVFATIHMNISQFIFAFLVGILFGIVRVKTEKMYPTMILHFLNNSFAVIEVVFYNHNTFMQIFTYLNIAINAIGFCLLIYMLYKKFMELKDKESIQRLKEQLDYRKIKLNVVENLYVFADYTFAVTVLLSITVFIAIERLMTIM